MVKSAPPSTEGAAPPSIEEGVPPSTADGAPLSTEGGLPSNTAGKAPPSTAGRAHSITFHSQLRELLQVLQGELLPILQTSYSNYCRGISSHHS